jgi:hypothetical protein
VSAEDVWQENKSYIVGVAGGLIIFVTAWYFVNDHYKSAIVAERAAIRSAEQKARAQKLQPGLVEQVKTDLDGLSARLEVLEREQGFKPQPGFTLAGAAKAPDVHFNEVVARMVTEVVEAGLSRDIRIQADLGLGGVTPRTNAEREWYLTGLDVVYRLAFAGIAAGVRSVEPLQIQRMPAPAKDKGRAAAPYVRAVSVVCSATGHPAAIDRMLRALLLPGQRLAVEQATITTMDEESGKARAAFSEQTVRLDMTVKALLLDPSGEPQRQKNPRL